MKKNLKLSVSMLVITILANNYVFSCPLCEHHAIQTAHQVAHHAGNQAFVEDLELQEELRHGQNLPPESLVRQDEDLQKAQPLLSRKNVEDNLVDRENLEFNKRDLTTEDENPNLQRPLSRPLVRKSSLTTPTVSSDDFDDVNDVDDLNQEDFLYDDDLTEIEID